MKKLLILTATIACLVSGAAFGQNVKLNVAADTKLPNTPFSEHYVDGWGDFKSEHRSIDTYEKIKGWFAKNTVTATKMGFLKAAKNPYLKTAPITMIAQGPVVYSSDKGTVDIIYAIQDVNSPSWAGKMYAYLISYDDLGRYIDSILASEVIVHTPADNNFLEEGSCIITYSNGIIQVQANDGGDTEMTNYKLNSQLKFIKQ